MESAGYDLYSLNEIIIPASGKILISTGISINLVCLNKKEKFYARIAPRSGLANKNGIDVLGGVIDRGYTGELKVILINLGKENFTVTEGQRIAQMVLCPIVRAKFEEVNKLPYTKRGKGGFGSTGK